MWGSKGADWPDHVFVATHGQIYRRSHLSPPRRQLGPDYLNLAPLLKARTNFPLYYLQESSLNLSWGAANSTHGNSPLAWILSKENSKHSCLQSCIANRPPSDFSYDYSLPLPSLQSGMICPGVDATFGLIGALLTSYVCGLVVEKFTVVHIFKIVSLI